MTLGIAFFVLFVAVWAVATLGGFVPKTFLADPITMVKSGARRRDGVRQGYRHDRLARGRRLCAGRRDRRFRWVLMGAYKPIEAFFEPFVSFARYLPASAFIPLLILWAGIGEAQSSR